MATADAHIKALVGDLAAQLAQALAARDAALDELDALRLTLPPAHGPKAKK